MGRAPRMRRVGAAQDGLHARHHLARVEGLGQVVVRAQLEAHDAVDVLAPGGEHEDGRLAAPPDLPGDLHAVPAGQHEVEHDEVRVDPVVLPKGFVAVARLDDREAGLLQVEAHQLDDVALVIDDEDRLHAREDSPGAVRRRGGARQGDVSSAARPRSDLWHGPPHLHPSGRPAPLARGCPGGLGGAGPRRPRAGDALPRGGGPGRLLRTHRTAVRTGPGAH